METFETSVYLLAAAAELTAEGKNFNACYEELTGLCSRAYKRFPDIETDLELIGMFKKSLIDSFNAAAMVNTAIIVVRLFLQ